MKLTPQVESANFIRRRIAVLEQALATLQLDSEDDEDSEDNEDSKDDLSDPLNTVRSVTPGAA